MAEHHQHPSNLVKIGVRAAEKAMRGKRPNEKTFTIGRRAAERAILAADPQAGTSTHKYRAARYSHGVYSLAKRSTNLARGLLWTTKTPAWEKRLESRRDTSKRNVRWFEERQDRAMLRNERIARLMRKLVDRQIALSNEARKTRSAKKRKELEDQAFRLSQRIRRLSDQASSARLESGRYGRAKTKIGVYDRTTGWSDRDARRRGRS